jgi:hypothetical protein
MRGEPRLKCLRCPHHTGVVRSITQQCTGTSTTTAGSPRRSKVVKVVVGGSPGQASSDRPHGKAGHAEWRPCAASSHSCSGYLRDECPRRYIVRGEYPYQGYSDGFSGVLGQGYSSRGARGYSSTCRYYSGRGTRGTRGTRAGVLTRRALRRRARAAARSPLRPPPPAHE